MIQVCPIIQDHPLGLVVRFPRHASMTLGNKETADFLKGFLPLATPGATLRWEAGEGTVAGCTVTVMR